MSDSYEPRLKMPLFDYNDISRATIAAAALPQGALNLYALGCCVTEVLNRGIIPESPGALQAILETSGEFIEIMNAFYPDPGEGTGPHDLGLDTADREWVMEIIALHFTGRSWPCNGDHPFDRVKFLAALIDALGREGWSHHFTVEEPET